MDRTHRPSTLVKMSAKPVLALAACLAIGQTAQVSRAADDTAKQITVQDVGRRRHVEQRAEAHTCRAGWRDDAFEREHIRGREWDIEAEERERRGKAPK